ncbi:MAG: hypothetical protein AB1333_04125 [Patescibacteria group bacterium]
MEYIKPRYITLIVITVIALALMSFVIRPNAEFNEDLGRHIKLGEIISETHTVPNINLFTYTNPDFPFINHHWLSEVIYFYLYSRFGSTGLEILTIFLLFSAFFTVSYIAIKKSTLLASLFSILLFIPLISDRIKVRPESFGYFLFALCLYFLFFKKTKHTIWVIPLLVLLWINLHITFAFGGLLIAAFILKEFITSHKEGTVIKNLFLFGGLCIAVLFVNPNGWKGALAPLSIFGNYGYRIVENQNLFFLIPRLFNWIYIYHLVAVGTFLIFFVWWFLSAKKNKTTDWNIFSLGLLTLICGIGGIVMVKNIPFFILSGIPTLALILSHTQFPKKINKLFPEELKTLLTSVLILGLLWFPFYFLKNGNIKMETYESGKYAVDFFIQKNIPGNIFNNFDIGGYLDYRLYPKYKTFVDNRPEAFPKEFFDEYISIQNNKEIRDVAFQKYNIQSIIFSHKDLTPWAQEFLGHMIQDKNWKAVYFDGYAVIFTKKEFPLQEIPLQSTPL